MVKQWFVLHTLTGQENKAQKSIEARVKLERMEDFVGRCVIPTERVTEKKDGRKRTITKKFFPGYVLCEHIAREELLRDRALLAVFFFGDALGRDHAPTDELFHTLELDPGLDRLLGLVLLAGERVKHKPLLDHLLTPSVPRSSLRQSLTLLRGRS